MEIPKEQIDYEKLCTELEISERIVRDRFQTVSEYLKTIQDDIDELRKSMNRFLKENKK